MIADGHVPFLGTKNGKPPGGGLWWIYLRLARAGRRRASWSWIMDPHTLV
jgi:hypothetical protein